MHRIDVPSATPDDQFTEGSPAAGVPATSVSAAWLNDVQEELISILTAAGITPVKGDQDQVLQAIQALITAQAGGIRSLSQNGYRQIGDFLLQWGVGGTVTGNQDTFNFPIAFPSEFWGMIPVERAAAGWGSTAQPTIYGYASLSLSQFKLSGARVLTGGGSQYQGGLAFFYVAIGK